MGMKHKSQKRFEQLRWMTETLFPALPADLKVSRCTLAAVLYSCWTQAWGVKFEFDATSQQIADAACINERTAVRALGILENLGVIKTIKRGAGRRGSIRRITGDLPRARVDSKQKSNVTRTVEKGGEEVP